MRLPPPGSFAFHAATIPPTRSAEARIADLVTAIDILANEGILDSFGHVSARSAKDPERFFMPRAMASALVTRADIVELGVRTIYTHIDTLAQSAAMAISPTITRLDAAELATNAAENFDADRPWQNYLQRLPVGR